jgi:hypothetical protein
MRVGWERPGKRSASSREAVVGCQTSPEAEQYAAERPVRLDRSTATGRAALEGRAIHIPDVLADPEYDSQRVFNFRINDEGP